MCEELGKAKDMPSRERLGLTKDAFRGFTQFSSFGPGDQQFPRSSNTRCLVGAETERAKLTLNVLPTATE